ncbi:MAG: cytochrome P450 [Verrucomicrobia bacterium]|nr:cytochrome P450 [Verrucomicrobiota bacterium]
MLSGKCPFGFGSRDPFKEKRTAAAAADITINGEKIRMLLRHEEVRQAAKDWQTFSSDTPFRVPIPSEEAVRSMRQLPIETNPPEHTEYRAIVEPFFNRAKQPEVITKVESLIGTQLDDALRSEAIEAVHDFALPIQSRALTYLLDVPESEAKQYISWGIHVFKVTNGEFKQGGDDFFSALTRARYQGRPLTREEMMGFANLTFAGGRDTVIHSLTSILAYFGENPTALSYLREDPRRIVLASEEFFRVFMPLTHIGRTCPVATQVQGAEVPAGQRISLGWASANFDEKAFAAPHEIRLDRKPNPHVSFGVGTHLCLGAPHARLLVRTLLQQLVAKIGRIDILSSVNRLEKEPDFERKVGYESLTLRFTAS